MSFDIIKFPNFSPTMKINSFFGGIEGKKFTSEILGKGGRGFGPPSPSVLMALGHCTMGARRVGIMNIWFQALELPSALQYV